MKARHHPRAQINRDCQNWPPNGSAELLVDDDYVDNGVINLPDGVGSMDEELSRARRRGCFNLALPPSAGHCDRDQIRDASLHRLSMRDL